LVYQISWRYHITLWNKHTNQDGKWKDCSHFLRMLFLVLILAPTICTKVKQPYLCNYRTICSWLSQHPGCSKNISTDVITRKFLGLATSIQIPNWYDIRQKHTEMGKYFVYNLSLQSFWAVSSWYRCPETLDLICYAGK